MNAAGGNTGASGTSLVEFVTVRIAGQLFGLPILEVEDVFAPTGITEVPLSSPEIAGVLNLRGRIVTAINMRMRLNLDDQYDDGRMAIGIQHHGESYGLIVDSVGEVLRLEKGAIEPNPINLNPSWSAVAAGIYQLDGELLVVLAVDRVLCGRRKHEQAVA